MKKYWRVGTKVKLNVYDGEGRPICQCHNEEDAELIVSVMNAAIEKFNELVKAVEGKCGR